MTYPRGFQTTIQSKYRASSRILHATLVAVVANVGFSALAIEIDPTYQELWEKGEYHEALEALQAQIASWPHQDSRYFRMLEDRAELNFAVGKIDAAIEDRKTLYERNNDGSEPGYALELALLYRYRGQPNYYQQYLSIATGMVRSRRWQYAMRHRNENLVAVGRILELTGINPKKILSAHYEQAFDLYSDVPAFVYVGVGDISYRTGGYNVAARYYNQALEENPEHQAALAGLAECYWQSRDERLSEPLDKLLELNPNHPRANAILVEQLLDKGDTAKAMEIIDRMLAINPRSYTFLGQKSAALFLEDRLDEMKRLQQAVLEFNPVCSTVYRITGRLASRHYRFQEGAEFQQLALERDPEDYEALALYTLDLMRLGRELEGRAELERAFEADPFNVQIYNMLELMDTLETFATIETDRFVLKLPEHEAPALAHESLDLLDRAFEHLEAKYDVDLETPVLVEMFDQHDDFMVRSVGLPGNVGHLGICFGKVVTMDTPSVRGRGSSNWRSVLWHEFVHVITLQKTKNRMPRWLSEGISVYEEGQYSEAWRNRLDPSHMQIIALDGYPKIDDIAAYFTQPKSGSHLMFGYFISAEFVQFFADTYGFEALSTTLHKIANKTDTDTALAEAAGVDLDALNKAFHDYLDVRLQPFENLPQVAKKEEQQGALDFFRNLLGQGDEEKERAGRSSPFTDAMREAKEAAESEDWDEAIRALNEAHDLFPDYQGADAPLRQLAAVYRKVGNEEKYLETLERLIYSTPTELDAAKAAIDIYRENQQWENMLEVADWSIGIDPYDPELHVAKVDGLTRTGHESEALETLELLATLDRNRAPEHKLRHAEILNDLGDFAVAKREVVHLLEEMPHYWQAQRLLLTIVDQSETPGEDLGE